MVFSIDGYQYIVKKGDTLYSISRKTGVPVSTLKEMNGGTDVIQIGQKFNIPDLNPNENLHEIPYIKDVPDTTAQENKISVKYNKHLSVVPSDGSLRFHVVKSGDNFSKIADKYGIELNYLLSVNGRDFADTRLNLGDKVKIPPARRAQNIDSIQDVADALGVSKEFISKLKLIEDGINEETGLPYTDTEFHNTPYLDKEGRETIGIGHLMKAGDKRNLTDKEAVALLANDLLKMQEALWAVIGKDTFEGLPQSIKDSLLDMTFNKGTAILNKSGTLIQDLQNGDYESAINQMTYNKSARGNELAGLSKRRLLDISLACSIYNGEIPQSINNTVQKVYNRGIELLRQECKQNKLSFANVVVGYNEDIQGYFGDKIKIELTTE